MFLGFEAGSDDSVEEITRSETARFSIKRSIENQDLKPWPIWLSNGRSNTLKDERRNDGGVKTANAIYHCIGRIKHV